MGGFNLAPDPKEQMPPKWIKGGFNPAPDPKEQMPPKWIKGGFNPNPNISNQIYLYLKETNYDIDALS